MYLNENMCLRFGGAQSGIFDFGPKAGSCDQAVNKRVNYASYPVNHSCACT